MTASNFERSVALIFESEAGYVNNPEDNGGPTNRGITIATLSDWRGHPASIADVQGLSLDEAKRIYRAKYWAAVKADQLPMGVDYVVFSAAVGSGPRKAIVDLQRTLHVVDDGAIGPLTLAAVYQVRAPDLITAFMDRRLAFLRSLGDWATFGKGWAARNTRERKDALAMAATPVPEPQTNDQPPPTGLPPGAPPVVPPPPPDDPGPVPPETTEPTQPADSGGFVIAALVMGGLVLFAVAKLFHLI